MLVDQFQRVHNYLRISLTDNCNFRCCYCIPEEAYTCLPKEKLMSASEIETIATIFVNLGIRKIRLTGGEPLLRKDFADIAGRLSRLPAELTLTTNAALIHRHIDVITATGMNTINVSLDTLKPDVFFRITKRNGFHQVWNNILLLLERNIRVKINVVAIKGIIENELYDFIRLTKALPLHVRFIEFMPFKGNGWSSSKVITAEHMLGMATEVFDLVKLRDEPHSTARKYKVIGYEGSVSFITTMSRQFCGGCNRLRLSAEGKMNNCLFGKKEISLLDALRKGESIVPLIRRSVEGKHAEMGGQFDKGYEYTDAASIVSKSMVSIGG